MKIFCNIQKRVHLPDVASDILFYSWYVDDMQSSLLSNNGYDEIGMIPPGMKLLLFLDEQKLTGIK